MIKYGRQQIGTHRKVAVASFKNGLPRIILIYTYMWYTFMS